MGASRLHCIVLGSRSDHSRKLTQQAVNLWLGFEQPALKNACLASALISDIHTVGINSFLTFTFLPTNNECQYASQFNECAFFFLSECTDYSDTDTTDPH
ncbi:hypothetical protein QQF64_033620 [Cirrhinus molitorella]|uniref:Uncharacterized protein n=1 Tax=Cirrhinus molitorella TaxID=172907 RepID=A0ABR3MUF7_9TELE